MLVISAGDGADTDSYRHIITLVVLLTHSNYIHLVLLQRPASTVWTRERIFELGVRMQATPRFGEYCACHQSMRRSIRGRRRRNSVCGFLDGRRERFLHTLRDDSQLACSRWRHPPSSESARTSTCMFLVRGVALGS